MLPSETLHSMYHLGVMGREIRTGFGCFFLAFSISILGQGQSDYAVGINPYYTELCTYFQQWNHIKDLLDPNKNEWMNWRDPVTK